MKRNTQVAKATAVNECVLFALDAITIIHKKNEAHNEATQKKHMHSHTYLSCERASEKKISVDGFQCSAIVLNGAVILVDASSTIIARRVHRTHCARQMLAHSLNQYAHRTVIWHFLFSFRLWYSSIVICCCYTSISKSEFHICRIWFYGSEKQCRK